MNATPDGTTRPLTSEIFEVKDNSGGLDEAKQHLTIHLEEKRWRRGYEYFEPDSPVEIIVTFEEIMLALRIHFRRRTHLRMRLRLTQSSEIANNIDRMLPLLPSHAKSVKLRKASPRKGVLNKVSRTDLI